MKKLTFLLLAALSGLAASAQTEKGSHLIGGSFSANHSNLKQLNVNPVTNQDLSTNQKKNTFSIGPSYSYFIADNLGLGVSLGYSNSHEDVYNSNQNSEVTFNAYTGSVSLDKYFLYDKKIGIRVGPYALYRFGKQQNYYADPINYNNEGTQKSISAGLTMAFVYFPVKKIALVAGIGSLSYDRLKYEDLSAKSTTNNFTFDLLSSASFSIYYSFGRNNQ